MKSDTAQNRNATPHCTPNETTKPKRQTQLSKILEHGRLSLCKKKERCSYSLLVSTLANMMLLQVTVNVRQIGGVGRVAARLSLSHGRCLFTCTATHCQ